MRKEERWRKKKKGKDRKIRNLYRFWTEGVGEILWGRKLVEVVES